MRCLILFFTSVLFVGCDLLSSEDEQEIVNGFKITTIEEIQRSKWDSGFFYQASEESGLEVSSVEEVTDLLNSKISKGVSIKSAWYKEHQSDCGTPNGIAYQVLVPATVVIQLNKKIDSELTNIFKSVEEPQLICPYFVKNLQPINE